MGTPDQDITQYSEWIERNPQDGALYWMRGSAYLKKEAYEEAVADLSMAIKLGDDEIARELLAEAYLMKGDFTLALHCIEEIEEGKEGIGFFILCNWWTSCLEKGDTERPLDFLMHATWFSHKAAHKIVSHYLLSEYQQLVKTLLERDEYQQVFQLLKGVLESERHELLMAIPDGLLDDPTDEANRRYQEAMQRNAWDDYVLEDWFRECVKRGEDETAFGFLEFILLEHPDGFDDFVLSGCLELRHFIKDEERLLAFLCRVIELAPRHPAGYYERGLHYQWNETYDLAKADLDKAIELDPGLSDIYYSRGRLHLNMADYRGAVKDLELAIRLGNLSDFLFGHCHEALGRAHRELGDLEKALTSFDKALDSEPDNVTALVHRGETYRQLGQIEQAITDLDRAIELDSEKVWAFVYRSATHMQVGEANQAVADLSRAIELDAENATAYTYRGAALRAMGQYAQAIVDMDWALQLESPPDWCATERSQCLEDWSGSDPAGCAAYLILEGDYAWAAQLFERAAGILTDEEDSERAADLLSAAADAYAQIERLDRADACRHQVARYRRLPHIQLTVPPETSLVLNEWDALTVCITNVGFAPAQDVLVRLSDRIAEPAQDSLRELPLNESMTIELAVKAIEVGRRVPLILEVEYTDSVGQKYHSQARIVVQVIRQDGVTVEPSTPQVQDDAGHKEAESEPYRHCPYCGVAIELPRTPRFCPYCGEALIE